MYTKLSLGSQRRAQFKGRLDNFCRFHWKDEDAFDKFGAFIITDNVGDLKFHSGPTWTNSYSQPQFGESGDLLGVSFSTYSISFKIGLYAISEDQWRQFLCRLWPSVGCGSTMLQSGNINAKWLLLQREAAMCCLAMRTEKTCIIAKQRLSSILWERQLRIQLRR